MTDATAILEQIATALEALAVQTISLVPNDQSFMEIWGWNLPAINRVEFANYIRSPIRMIRSLTDKEVTEPDYQTLSLYPSRIAFFQANALQNLPGGNAFQVYLTARSLIDGLNGILSPYAPDEIDWESTDNDKVLPAAQLRKLRQTQRAIERLSSDSAGLKTQIKEINAAHKAALDLPTSLSELSDAKSEYSVALDDLLESRQKVIDAKSIAEQSVDVIQDLSIAAENQMKNIDAAYSAATTQGLGKAFGDKAVKLADSTWWLMAALAGTLGIGACITHNRVEWLHTLMGKPNVSLSLLWLNLLLTIASVAGPIWFAWLLTKQIGQRFRLAEDYDFKASVAKAYEGYRREAINIDPEQGKRLFSMALDRLSEEPLRHVEKQTHGTPLQEIVSNLSSKRPNGRKSHPLSETSAETE